MSTNDTEPRDDASRNTLVVLTDGQEQEHDHVESVEQWQSLEPGYYWTAQKDWSDKPRHSWGSVNVDKDETLLLLEVMDDHEGKAHSVRLRVHPTKGPGHIDMLVDQFLDVFLP